ncbi:MAG TPA: EamA family transporter [Vicinamibacterales bacterium]|nr:EamA family transporter [Vicinamibacterales bacterium]
MLTFAFIVVRILANPLANVFQKQLTQRSVHPIFVIAVVHTVLAIGCLPYCLVPGRLDLAAGVWSNMITAALLAVTGNVLLVYALSGSDLSILGPVNAYKSVVSLGLGVFLVGERPTPIGLLGVLLIVAGSYFVIDRKVNQPLSNAFVRFVSGRGVQLRFAALFLSATEALFLKRAIVLSSPAIVFVLWSVLGFAIALAWTLLSLRRELAGQLAAVKSAFVTFVRLALATGAMQLATVLTFRDLQVGYSLALFQLSTIVTVLLGRRFFAETNIGERLIGSIVMAAGAALIVVFGTRQ